MSKRPLRSIISIGAAVAAAVAGVPLLLGAAPAAAAAPVTDTVTVQTTGYSLTSNVTSGGVAVLDDPGNYETKSVTGRAVLTGGAEAVFAITKQLLGFGGTFTLNDTAGGTRIDASVSGGVTRVSDSTLRWSGSATVKRGTTSTQQTVTVTVVDNVLDPGDHAVHLAHAGQNRVAFVHVPTGHGGETGLPALFHFPGLLEWPSYAADSGKLIPASDRNGYLLVVPEHYGIGWQNVLGGTPGADVDDPGFIRALAGVVKSRFGADPDRIYSSGMSNGGFFSSLTACKLADLFAAFAPVSGQLNDPSTCAPGRTVPVVMFHGDADPIVNYDTVAPAVAFWTRNNGCSSATTDTTLPNTDPNDGTTVVRHVYQGCPADAPVVLYQIVGGGHAWPGGNGYPAPVGNVTKDIDGNQIIWDFVSRFTLS